MSRRAIPLLLVVALLATSCLDPLVRSGLTWSGIGLPDPPPRHPAPLLVPEQATPGAYVTLTHPSIEPGELARVTMTIAGATIPLPAVADADGRVRIPAPVLPGAEDVGGAVELRVGYSHASSLRVGPLPPALDPVPGVVSRAVLGAVGDWLDAALLRLARIEDELADRPEGVRSLTEGEEGYPPLVDTLDAIDAGIFETSLELLEMLDALEEPGRPGAGAVPAEDDLRVLDRLLSAWLVGAVEELERIGGGDEQVAPAVHHLPAVPAQDAAMLRATSACRGPLPVPA